MENDENVGIEFKIRIKLIGFITNYLQTYCFTYKTLMPNSNLLIKKLRMQCKCME